MRQWVTRRALLLHLAFVAIVCGCLYAGWWQVHRAMAGNALSYLYSVEWPAFAVVAGIGWWQMVHDTPDDLVARKEYHARMRAASAAVVARTLPRSALAITAGSEEVSGRRLAGSPGRALGDGCDRSGTEPGAVPAVPRVLPDVRGADGATALLDPEELPPDDMAEYNRYLALLAVRGKAKTWRNPRGI